MPLNIYLSVASILIVFHLSEAVPLRHHLEKRAAFYIANETACVVDNIVYSSGDPIPTDDPCEACRCRPPGFACVLKECRIKPGCRAVRQAGQCCPDYVCGCEHDGKFYKDGEEIQDPKTPCYKCYCQGSSIACAFVDCIYRDECDSVFVPGECCPKYINCTTDIPDRNLFIGDNILPPVNLLTVLNDETMLSGVVPPAAQNPGLPEESSSPIQPSDPVNNAEKSELADVPSVPEIVETESPTTEIENVYLESEEKDTATIESDKEDKEDRPKENDGKQAADGTDETKALLNSKSDINKDDTTENSESQENDKLPTEAEKDMPQTTQENKMEVIENSVTTTEMPVEAEPSSTEVTEKDSRVKNSASENSKSLKLSDTDEPEKIEQPQTVKPNQKETVTELPLESTSVASTDMLKSTTMISKSQSEENVAEENQNNPQGSSFYSNEEKVKSKSSETVTVVVHVKEGTKQPTETSFIADTVTPSSATNVTEENLLKSNEEIKSTGMNEESSEPENNESTIRNFEIFPVTKASETEFTSKLPSTELNTEENVQGRSDNYIAMEAEESPVHENKESDLKNENDLSVTTTTTVSTEVSKEARADEEMTEGTKLSELIITAVKRGSIKPVTVEIMTDSENPLSTEKTTTQSVNEKIEKLTEEEKKDEKAEEIVEETSPEVREDSANAEETTIMEIGSTQKEEKSTEEKIMEFTTEKAKSLPEEKIQETTLANADKLEKKTDDEVENNEDKTSIKNTENKTTEQSKSEEVTESQNQTTERSTQTTSV